MYYAWVTEDACCIKKFSIVLQARGSDMPSEPCTEKKMHTSILLMNKEKVTENENIWLDNGYILRKTMEKEHFVTNSIIVIERKLLVIFLYFKYM